MYKQVKALLLIALFTAAGLAQSFAAATVKSVGSVVKDGETHVVVTFSEAVDPTSAANPANYTIPTVGVSSASMITGLPADNALGNDQGEAPNGRVNNNEAVQLVVTGLGSTATSITVRNVRDSSGALIADKTVTFTPSGYKWVETGALGSSALPGRVIPIDDDGFDIFSSGATQWSTYDEVTFVYKEVAGDFDYKARLEHQDASSRWARAGIMVREDLDVRPRPVVDDPATHFHRYVDMHANPARSFNNDPSPMFIAANNQFESHVRMDVGGETASVGGGTPAYPNAWLRIARVGQVFTSFRSDDGDTWTEQTVRDFTDAPFPATVFLGPSFSPETGNINVAHGTEAKNRLFLAQVRFTKIAVPIVKSFTSGAAGFSFTVDDSETMLVPDSVVVKLDDTVVTTTKSKVGTRTTISYLAPTPFISGSVHNVELSYFDNGNPPSGQVVRRSFTVAPYVTLTAAMASPAGSVVTATNGFRARVHQLEVGRGNTIAETERQLANGYIDPATGQPYPNMADLTGADAQGYFYDADVINWWDSDENGRGNFTDANGYPDEPVPGASGDNIAAEILTFVTLKAGVYTMGVNSDDGFKVTAGSQALDIFAARVGSFDGGRGASDSLFDFLVEADGIYPFRLIWFEGGGGASLEWFMVTPAGEKVLLNDPSKATSVKTYAYGTANAYGSYVASVSPGPGATEVDPATDVTVKLVDGNNTVTLSTVQLTVDGQVVAATKTKTSGVTTVSFNPAANFGPGNHTLSLSYETSTSAGAPRVVNWNFVANYLTADTFFIEIEDFDFDGGQHKVEADSLDYAGGAYDQLSAVLGVDFQDNGNPEADIYRVGETPNVGMAVNGDTGRGDAVVTTNHKIGWTGAGEWYNYTRTFPAGLYKVVARMSHGDGTQTMGGDLQLITAGVGTATQTTTKLGDFRAPASGGWDTFNFVPLKDAAGAEVLVRLGGLNTVRYTVRLNGGDMNYLAFIPQADVKLTPVLESTFPTGVAIQQHSVGAVIKDRDTKVVASSVRLFVNGTDVTGQSTVTDTATGASISYVVPNAAANDTNTVRVVFADDSPTPVSAENTFIYRVSEYSTSNFFIEAEDFNYDGGQFKAGTAKGQYQGLSAVLDVDFKDNGNPEADVYRIGELPNVGMTDVFANDRGAGIRPEFTTAIDYKIGWTGSGEWYNYTRDIPAGSYNVLVRISHGDAAATMGGQLDLVGGDTTTTAQTLTKLGTFTARATGGWDNYTYLPLLADDGSKAVVSLGGRQTLRYTVGFGGGDFSYMMLVPVSSTPPPPRVAISLTGTTINISWTGGGTLESAPSVTGPWTSTNDSDGSYSEPATAPAKFFRVRR